MSSQAARKNEPHLDMNPHTLAAKFKIFNNITPYCLRQFSECLLHGTGGRSTTMVLCHLAREIPRWGGKRPCH